MLDENCSAVHTDRAMVLILVLAPVLVLVLVLVLVRVLPPLQVQEEREETVVL